MSDRIDEIVGSGAFDQVDLLIAKLFASNNLLKENLDSAIKLNAAIGGAKSFKEYTKTVEEAERSIIKMQKSQENARLAEIRLQQQRKKAFDKYEAQLRRQESAQARAAATAAKAASPYNQLTTALAKAEKKALDLGASMGVKSREFKKASKEVQELRKKVDSIEQPIGRFQRNVGNYSSAVKGFLSNIKTLVLGYLSIQAAINSVSAAYRAAVAADSTRTALEFIFQSASVADQKLKQLQKTAERLGLDFVSLADSYKSFIGAAIASNFSLEKAEHIFDAVSNAGAKLRLSSEQMKGALLALQQMISKGSVQAEELRGQLGERLPGAFAIAARAMGMTEAELSKMLQKGEIVAADLLPKLAVELDKTFDNDKTEKVESLSGSMSRLGNVFTELVSEEQGIGNFFRVVIDWITLASKAIADTVSSKSWTEFFLRLSGSQKPADVIRSISSAIESAGLSVKSAFEFDVSKASGQQIKAQYEDVSATLEKAADGLKTYRDAINDPKLAKPIFRAVGKEIQGLEKSIALLSSKKSQLEMFLPIEASGSATNQLTASEIAEQKRRSDQLRRDQLELNKAKIQAAKETLQVIYNDESVALDQRLAALALFNKKSQDLIKNDRDIQLADTGASKYKIQAIELRYDNDLLKLKSDTKSKELSIIKDVANKEIAEYERIFNQQIAAAKKADKALLDNLALAVEQRQALLNESAQRELVALAQSYANGEINAEEYAQKRLEIQRKLNEDLLNQEIKNIELIISLQKAAGKDTADNEKKLAELKQRLSKETTDAQIQDLEKLAEREKELKEKRMEIAQELGNFAIAMVQKQFQESEYKLQKEGEQIDINRAKEVEAVERSILSEQDKAARIAIIDAKAQSKKEALERRQRQLDIDRAKFEKSAGIARIIVDTASAVAEALPNVPLSILVGALGAAQLATAVAAPLPKFEKGGKMKKTGLAEFGHGTELRIDPDGTTSLTPSTPTVGIVKQGTEFISNRELIKLLAKPDPVVYTAGMQIDLDKVIESQERTRRDIVAAVSLNNRRGKGVGYYSSAKGRNYINRNI